MSADDNPAIKENDRPTPAPKGRKWYNYILRTKFQSFVLIGALVTNLISLYVVFLVYQNHLSIIKDLLRHIKNLAQEQLMGYLNNGLFYNFLMVVLFSIVLLNIMILLFMSHKVAGPMLRINKHFKRLAQENLDEPIHFRHYDYLMRDVETNINSYIQRVKDLEKNKPH